MTAQRQLLIWVVAALTGLLFLVVVLTWQHRTVEPQWNTFLVGDPLQGAQTFEQKRCSNCHAVCGAGTTLAPDLELQRTSPASMNQLTTQMWNHAPRMWARLEGQRVVYPSFTAEEMANLFAYLFTTCYVDESGDPARGNVLFSSKGCIRCHSAGGRGGEVGPAVDNFAPVETPILWAQAMWNHAPAMESHMHQFGIRWPRFEGKEMNDLLAFIREERGGPRREFEVLPADPHRGWNLFRSKGCISCHSVHGQGGTTGPDLGAGHALPPTVTQVAGEMWNHSPQMWAAMKEKGIERPAFQGKEMADIIAFLYSLHYFEFGGSPLVGRDLFTARKCGRCHGADGLGGEFGPGLRKRGRLFTPVSLAQALWSHGPTMYRKSQQLGVGWPTLEESDLDHLLAFLNTPPEEKH